MGLRSQTMFRPSTRKFPDQPRWAPAADNRKEACHHESRASSRWSGLEVKHPKCQHLPEMGWEIQLEHSFRPASMVGQGREGLSTRRRIPGRRSRPHGQSPVIVIFFFSLSLSPPVDLPVSRG